MSTSVVVSSILGVVLFNETLKPMAILGIALVILGMVILEMNSFRKKGPSE